MNRSHLRLGYALTNNFSLATTIVVAGLYIAAGLGLVVFNFLTQAKRPLCTVTTIPNYDAETCDPSPLGFFGTYYTRPQTENSIGTIGTFPWLTNGFSVAGSNATIDYSELTLNWTANPLECAMYQQALVLHLDTLTSTTAACYYCGDNLRVLCTSIDSERSTIPLASWIGYQQLAQKYRQNFLADSDLAAMASKIVYNGIPNATVTAIRVDRSLVVPGVEPGVLPYTENFFDVALGTTLGYYPISNTDSNPVIASIAESGASLSDFVESLTSQDLQPDTRNSTNLRTLNTNYICKTCVSEYKSALEIFSIIIGATFGTLGTIYAILIFLAQRLTTSSQSVDYTSPAMYMPSGSPGGFVTHHPGLGKHKFSNASGTSGSGIPLQGP